MLTIEDKFRIREKIPHGGGKRIAVKAGVSTAQVTNWFGSKRNSPVIEQAVFDVLKEYEAERTQKLKEAGLLKQSRSKPKKTELS